MKKFVVTEIEIFDQEKYDNCSDKPYIGLVYDVSNHAIPCWSEMEDGSFRFKLEDQTDDDWNKIPRMFTIAYEDPFGITQREVLSSEKEVDRRTVQLQQLGTKQIRFEFMQI